MPPSSPNEIPLQPLNTQPSLHPIHEALNQALKRYQQTYDLGWLSRPGRNGRQRAKALSTLLAEHENWADEQTALTHASHFYLAHYKDTFSRLVCAIRAILLDAFKLTKTEQSGDFPDLAIIDEENERLLARINEHLYPSSTNFQLK